MLLLDQEVKALGLAELLSNSSFRVEIMLIIAERLATHPERNPESIQLFSRAFNIADTITDNDRRVPALSKLGVALAQAQQWKEAERVIGTIKDSEERARALRELGVALAQAQQWKRLLNLVQRLWQQTQSRQDILGLLPIAFKLIPLKDEIGIAFYDAFNWVDDFFHKDEGGTSKQ